MPFSDVEVSEIEHATATQAVDNIADRTTDDKTDARRVFMSLTDRAKAMMDEYLSIYYAGRKT